MVQSNSAAEPGRLYFAYGSNLSTTQMQRRCPHSTPIGLARLADWTWIINERGYANIIPQEYSAPGETESRTETDLLPSLSPGNPGVYGLVYRLHPDDEAKLDRYEGVGFAYEKETVKIPRTEFVELHLVGGSSSSTTKASLQTQTSQYPTEGTKTPFDDGMAARPLHREIELDDEIELLVYIDTINVTPSAPEEEYIGRMNLGIKEASKWGLTTEYVNCVIRQYIPASV
ncbi:hypothetical protein F5Y09DRAFT_239959 [Xylaria sp. FL1042]|nr:hypothetical protein F5Y09DRAFT_239959 [Xylaria sp. FL1042]